MITRDQLRNYLTDELAIDLTDVQDSDLLFTDGILDSFAVADLIVFLEELGGFVIDPEEIVVENLDSIELILTFSAMKCASESEIAKAE